MRPSISPRPRLAIAGRKLRTVALDGRLAGGDVTLKELSFALGGGRLSASGTLKGEDKDGRLALRARLAKAEIAALARELGATGNEIRGRLEAAARLSMSGPTVGVALKRSDGAAVLLMRDGQVAQSLIEQLSSDLRALFRDRQESVPVTCLLGIVTLKDGIGVISPLRLELQAAVAVGAGKIDLARKRLDLTVRTERDSTSFFALDIPVRISGPLDRLSAAPLAGRDEDWLRQPTAAEALPPERRRACETPRWRGRSSASARNVKMLSASVPSPPQSPLLAMISRICTDVGSSIRNSGSRSR